MKKLILLTTYVRRDQATELAEIASLVKNAGIENVTRSDLFRWCVDEGLERLRLLLPELLEELTPRPKRAFCCCGNITKGTRLRANHAPGCPEFSGKFVETKWTKLAGLSNEGGAKMPPPLPR